MSVQSSVGGMAAVLIAAGLIAAAARARAAGGEARPAKAATRPAAGAPAVGPKPGEPWRGVHLGINGRSIGPLAEEVPKLAALGVNVLVVEVNYNFEYASHPELRSGTDVVTRRDARGLAKACRAAGVRLIPQFQCLGHQSWKARTAPLLRKHPELDETPGQYPGKKGIYCRSWCPLHPKVNPIVFALMDELVDAFGADALHVGMDEVFLIGSEHCPRCRGKRPAELFASAVNDYHKHLVKGRGLEMLMWGDRLIPARMGYGKWESSHNDTAPAVEKVPRDVIICDWHYGKRGEYPSVPMFLKQGFRVWPAGWRDVAATEALIADSRKHGSERMLGHLCTTWGQARPPKLHAFAPIVAAMNKLGPPSRP